MLVRSTRLCLLGLCVLAVGACASAEANDGGQTQSEAESGGSETRGEPACGEGLAIGKAFADCEFDVAGASWSWRREAPQSWSVRPGVLEMRSLPGTLWEENNDTANVALREIPELGADGHVDLHVEGPVASDGEQAGLLWFVDDDHYVKLVKEQVFGNRMVVMVTEIEGNPSILKFEELEAEGAHALNLRLSLEGDELVGWALESGGSQYREIARTSADLGAQEAQEPRIGLFTQGAQESENRWIRFTGFGVYPD